MCVCAHVCYRERDQDRSSMCNSPNRCPNKCIYLGYLSCSRFSVINNQH